MENNIFNYATSELSQDAFICWCLNWLNYKESELRFLAIDLLKEFGEETVFYDGIIIKKQFMKIDILIILKKLNKIYIIEDRVNNHERGNQINSYKEKIKNLTESEKKDLGIDITKDLEIKTVYFKTGFYFSSDENVKADKKITGEIFKKVLEKYQNKNEILNSYYKYLSKKLEKEKNEENYLEVDESKGCKEWNIAQSNIAQYCFMKEIFFEERIISFRNRGGTAVSQYNLLGKNILMDKTNEELGEFSIFWRIDTLKNGPYLRLNYYYKYKNKENGEKISQAKYDFVYKKIYDTIEKQKNKFLIVYKTEKRTSIGNEVPILHIDLKEYIKGGTSTMNNLINEVKKLHICLKNEKFE